LFGEESMGVTAGLIRYPSGARARLEKKGGNIQTPNQTLRPALAESGQ